MHIAVPSNKSVEREVPNLHLSAPFTFGSGYP
jgi:hypothetical protein